MGLPRYNWWAEASSGIDSARNMQTTKFPFPITTGRLGEQGWRLGSFQDNRICLCDFYMFTNEFSSRLAIMETQQRNELQSKPLEACGPTNWSGSSCCDECRKCLLHILGTGHQSCQGSLAPEAWDVRRLGKRSHRVCSCEYFQPNIEMHEIKSKYDG